MIEVLEAQHPAHRDEQRQHHRDARENRAGDEVRREDRAVPARQLRHREIPATPRCAPTAPAAWRGPPAADRPSRSAAIGGRCPAIRIASDGVELLAPAGRDLARVGDVGNQPHEQEQGADRQVGADREKVPGQRRAKIGLQKALVGIRHEPVEKPRAARDGSAETDRRSRPRRRSWFRRRDRPPCASACETETEWPRSACPSARYRPRRRSW